MKPILFSTPMVQAILDGRKTMTRRVIKIPSYLWENPTILEPDCCAMFHYGPGGCQNHSSTPLFVNSKYQVGDVLWVRETWCKGTMDRGTAQEKEIFLYRADEGREWTQPNDGFKMPCKPSIFMPKEACRIFLRVTNVKVERLKDISEEDCLAEGIYEHDDNDCTGKYKAYTIKKPNIQYGIFIDDKFNSAYEAFEWLWNSINGKGTWEANPYVFVYEFERINYVK